MKKSTIFILFIALFIVTICSKTTVYKFPDKDELYIRWLVELSPDSPYLAQMTAGFVADHLGGQTCVLDYSMVPRLAYHEFIDSLYMMGAPPVVLSMAKQKQMADLVAMANALDEIAEWDEDLLDDHISVRLDYDAATSENIQRNRR